MEGCEGWGWATQTGKGKAHKVVLFNTFRPHRGTCPMVSQSDPFRATTAESWKSTACTMITGLIPLQRMDTISWRRPAVHFKFPLHSFKTLTGKKKQNEYQRAIKNDFRSLRDAQRHSCISSLPERLSAWLHMQNLNQKRQPTYFLNICLMGKLIQLYGDLSICFFYLMLAWPLMVQNMLGRLIWGCSLWTVFWFHFLILEM